MNAHKSPQPTSVSPALVGTPTDTPTGSHPSGFDPSRCAEAFHPTEHINDELKARGWDKFDLLARMGGDPARTLLSLDVYFIVGPTHPNCRLGDVLAHQIAVALDVSPQFLLNLEAAWLAHPTTQALANSAQGGDA